MTTAFPSNQMKIYLQIFFSFSSISRTVLDLYENDFIKNLLKKKFFPRSLKLIEVLPIIFFCLLINNPNHVVHKLIARVVFTRLSVYMDVIDVLSLSVHLDFNEQKDWYLVRSFIFSQFRSTLVYLHYCSCCF